MPLFHVHGLLAAFLAPLYAGGSVIVPQKFSASEFWADFVNYQANWYTAVPTIHQILLKTPLPNPIPNIRFIRSCSSPLSPKTLQDLEKTFNAPVLEAYAMTEAAHQMTSNPLPPGRRQPGSVGIGMGVEVRILDGAGKEVPQGTPGEICVCGENVTKGYLNNPSANESSFTKDGFFRTGDQGIKDSAGYVIITGRIKELINKGGEKISPIEIDNTLLHHPKVAEAVSFAIPDEGHYGEDIGAAVVLKSEGVTDQDLKSWVGDKLAKFKVPRQVRTTLPGYVNRAYIDMNRSGSCHKSPRRPLERSSDVRWPKQCSSQRRSYKRFTLRPILLCFYISFHVYSVSIQSKRM